MPPLNVFTLSLRPLGQPGQVERLGDSPLRRLAIEVVERREEPQVLGRRQLVDEGQLLGDQADPRFEGVGVAAETAPADPSTSPESGGSSPAIMATVVVLPAPLGPSRPTVSPAAAPNVT